MEDKNVTTCMQKKIEDDQTTVEVNRNVQARILFFTQKKNMKNVESK